MGLFDRRRPLAERKRVFAKRRTLRSRLPRWRARRWLSTALLVLAGATLGPVACLRYVDPVTSAFMLRDGAARLTAGKGWIAYDWVDLRDISGNALLAVVAAEDQRFPLHDGFDFEAIQKAVQTNRGGGTQRGASTISQQVAKNLFLWPERSWLRKGLEVYFTVAIETLWPKRRILEVYLNVAQFGDGVYGVGAAAQRHFGTTARRLSPHQAALLAAVLPSPRKMNAGHPGPYTAQRARWIQGQMRQLGSGYLTKL